MAELRIVKRVAVGTGWCVIAEDDGPAVHATTTKKHAVELARSDLCAQPDGGTLRVHLADGRIEYERSVDSLVARAGQGNRAPTALEPLLDAHRQIKQDGEHMDKALDGLDVLLSLLGYLGVPITSAVISPEVRSALGDGWLAVFFATLTWTLGCTGAVIVLRRSGLIGYPLLTALSLCFLGALAIAGWVGRGVLDIEPFADSYLGPFTALGAFVAAAFITYGWLGATLGAGIGAILGYRLSRLVPEGFANHR